ncbi:hypothetical protein CEF21_15330 [Bacillus sp. FJAT-42376]|uniref:hypothetical protein n=1 Tax=Bacillus sp. FJAT-42376 TaxID=2014076 RepID=UPI000F4F5612|nr:hypothetical protein [Bacillus sp. FJAT-42376]AZB43565.1 hypothetical protein CEF21_15330 [Bacillus sp. FJAT-42376]
MFKKVCPRCAKSSYSSYNGGAWVCPVCSNDLSFQRVLFENAQTKVTPLKGKYNENQHRQKSFISLYA